VWVFAVRKHCVDSPFGRPVCSPRTARGLLDDRFCLTALAPEWKKTHLMADDIDFDKITEGPADNSKVDEKLRQDGIDPDKISELGPMSEEALEKILNNEELKNSLIFRPRNLTMYFGPEHPVGAGVINDTTSPMDQVIAWEDTIGVKIDASISATASASFFDLVKGSVTVTFSLELSYEHKFSDSFKITIQPKEYGWLTRRGMMSDITTDVILYYHSTGIMTLRAWRCVTLTGYAGNDGRPDSWITGHTRPYTNSTLQALAADKAGLVARDDHGLLTFPAVLLDLMDNGDASRD
jgi:hypothetical protein